MAEEEVVSKEEEEDIVAILDQFVKSVAKLVILLLTVALDSITTRWEHFQKPTRTTNT